MNSISRGMGTWLVHSIAIGAVMALVGCGSDGQTGSAGHSAATSQPTPLSNGRSIDPHPTSVADVGSIPFNIIPSPDGKFAITTDQGYRQMLCTIRTSDGAVASKIEYPKSQNDPHNGLYYGLAFGPDNMLYAAQGNHDSISIVAMDAEGKLSVRGSIETRKGDFPSGLAIDDRGRLFVANNDPLAKSARSFQQPGSIAIYDTASRQEIGRFEFTESFGGTPNFPLAVAVLHDGSKAYVASQRDAAVYVLNTADPAHPSLVSKIETGAHPISLLFDKSQSRLFVANAHSDTVSIVETKTDKVVHTILLRPEIAKDVAGATPDGLALSPDEKTLYVTLGDMNAVAVVDVEDAALEGYIAAGWYPTGVVAAADNQRLFVANAKGIVARHPNPPGGGKHQVSPISLLEGTVISLAIPNRKELPEETTRVLELNRLTPKHIRRQNPLAGVGLQAGKIKHVIYIVKENRTYDQVLGDLPQGNGDPARCLFGRAVTPNLHAIAERFVLLDNFYDCGEVSGDGWNWSTQAQANEYIVRNVPYSYSDRGRTYDYEGQINEYPSAGFPARGPDGKLLSVDPKYKDGGPSVPDVALSPGGHIWDLVCAGHLSCRNFGFFLSDGVRQGKAFIVPENYPNAVGLQPAGHDLVGISDLDFMRFDLRYPDSEAPLHYSQKFNDPTYLRPRKAYGIHDAPSRFSEWNHEFQAMLAKAPDGSAVPNFMTVRFCVDHTMGTNPEHHSPRSMVADNDYAVGQLVEAISHSAVWNSTAIFIIEDDAQNGPDHVDAHRSTCYVISPWIKAHSVDHTFQNTTSVLRTMELLMGLPPMCQYDATADPILDWDTTASNAAPYSAIEPDKEILREINGKSSPKSPISPEQKAMMDESSHMDFAHADRAPAERLNQIIWASVKGNGSVMPSTPHGPPPTVPRQIKKDEDD